MGEDGPSAIKMGAKGFKLFLSFCFEVILVILTAVKLRTIQNEFAEILVNIPDAIITLRSTDKYWGPVHVICSSLSCSGVPDGYKDITSTQSYMTMEWMDTRDGSATIDDMIDARDALYIYLVIILAVYILLGCCADCVAIFQPDDTSMLVKIYKGFSSVLQKWGIIVAQGFICNIFSISEIAPNVYEAQYIPGYMIIVSFIAGFIIMCCVSCMIGGVAANDGDSDTITGILICAAVCCYLASFVLFGIPGMGLGFYVVQYNHAYTNHTSGNLLNPSYADSTVVLAELGITFSIGGYISMGLTFIMECLGCVGVC